LLLDFVESFAKNANLQKVSASLFNFLDDKGKGYITFTELVRKLYPGMKAEQLRLALEWSQEETNLEKTQGQKKYLEEANKLRKGIHGGFEEAEKRSPVPKEGVKKLKQMFDMYDKEHKGCKNYIVFVYIKLFL
jgi:Ca2+-binding EF-hand superfamily protein